MTVVNYEGIRFDKSGCFIEEVVNEHISRILNLSLLHDRFQTLCFMQLVKQLLNFNILSI